ncbi:MAG: F0F1 ATP synthase subunit A [Clostridiales bacterium]|nr:F0F1 ATP synthase subunit A [Clostridiales bacterium]
MDWIKEVLRSFVEHFVEEWKIGDIGEEINHGILQWKTDFFNIGNIPVVLTDAIIVSWIAIGITVLLFAWMSAKPKLIPGAKQTFVEAVVGLIISTSMSFGMNRKEAEHIAPMIGTIGLIILGCNVISAFKLSPPAKNIAFPVAMAIVAIVYVIYVSIRFVGFKGFWVYMTSPMPALLPFKVLDFIVKPFSLALRLFGNVFGAFVFMEFLFILCPVIFPGVFSLWFDIADGMIQAVVFAYLTMSYIGEIVEVGHEYHEHPENFIKEKKQKKVKAQKALEV